MDCWIGLAREGNRRILRLAGRLTVEQVADLFRVCAEPGPLEVDLDELISADVAGIEALQRIRARGAQLVGVPGYLQLKIDSAAEPPGVPIRNGPRLH